MRVIVHVEFAAGRHADEPGGPGDVGGPVEVFTEDESGDGNVVIGFRPARKLHSVGS